MKPSRCQLCAAPPATSCDSTTVTFLPYLASKAPAQRPPMPAPMTTTSVSWLLSVVAAPARTRREDLMFRRLDDEARVRGRLATVDAAGTDAEVRIVAPIMFPWTDVDAMTPRFGYVSRRGCTPLWLQATSMAWIDSELSQPRDLPLLFIFPGRESDALRHSPPPARPHETRDRPIGVHARSHVTCQGGFRRLREDTRRVSPAACHPPR